MSEIEHQLRHTRVPPKLVEDVIDDPKAIEPIARAMAAINLDRLFVRMADPSAPLQHKLEFQKLLNEMGKITTKEQPLTQASLPLVVINVDSGGIKTYTPNTIDVVPNTDP